LIATNQKADIKLKNIAKIQPQPTQNRDTDAAVTRSIHTKAATVA